MIFTTGDVGNLHVVGGWGKIFQLLAGEDIDGDQVDFGVTVLSSLGGGHVDDLAWTTLDNNVAVLSQGGTLHGKGGRGAGVGGLEGVLMLEEKVVSTGRTKQDKPEQKNHRDVRVLDECASQSAPCKAGKF